MAKNNVEIKGGLCNIMLFAAALLIIVALLFTSLQVCMNRRGWYYQSYVKYGTAAQTGISEEDMTSAIFRLIDYMEGRVDDIQLGVTENGKLVEMYNRQEIDHMVDVRGLYQAWRGVRDYGTVGAIALFTACAMLYKGQNFKRKLGKSFLWACAALGGVLVVSGVWVAIDFNSFWTAFHHLFFTNDLWLMDYATCRMIRICPLQLFNDIVVRFALIFLIPLFALMVPAALLAWRKKA